MIKISACVIVKNEAHHLPRWFRWAKIVADEIIVVDTGSTDETVALSEHAGAKVYHFPWCDDFAAAKNFALSHATGHWVAFLDADEYFTDEDAAKVRDVLSRQPMWVDVVINRGVNIDVDQSNRYIDAMVQWRLFRRRPGLRYAGKIHEILEDTAGKQVRAQFSDALTIYHTGYSSSVMRKKVERNLQILLAERENRRNPTDAFYLADCYYNLDEYELAEKYAREGVEHNVRIVGSETRLYCLLVLSMLQLRRAAADMRVMLDRAAMTYPGAAEVSFMRGLVCFREKEYPAAISWYEKGLAEYETAKQKAADAEPSDAAQGVRGDQASNFLAHVYWHLGQMATWRGKQETALQYYTEGLKDAPYHVEMLNSLARLLRGLPAVDVIAFLATIYDKTRDALLLSRTFAAAGCGEVALYYDQQAGGAVLSEVDKFLCADRLSPAVAVITDTMDASVKVALWAESRPLEASQKETLQTLLPPAYRAALGAPGRDEWSRMTAGAIDRMKAGVTAGMQKKAKEKARDRDA